MKLICKLLVFLGIFAGVGSCLEPYNPPILSQQNYLVVEGTIVSGGVTRISLSRTSNLTDTSQISRVQKASVVVESENGFRANLYEAEAGRYYSSTMNLDPNDRYRLLIATADQQLYESEFVSLKQTPAIDSISWEKRDNGVQVYVNSHDPLNTTRYYKWEYEETWEYNVPFLSPIDYEDGGFVNRKEVKPVNCWQYKNSTNILIGSSAKLGNDIIYLHPLTYIPQANVRLSAKYSILVRQQAISKEAYEYFQQMKRNTEQSGTFYDPQPSEIRGNIYNVNNANEPVIGFVVASTVQEKRMFIRNGQVRPWGYSLGCAAVEVELEDYDDYFNGLYEPISVNPSGIATAAIRYCTDCSLFASPLKPAYWE